MELNFSTEGVEQPSYDAIPEGWYAATIVKSEIYENPNKPEAGKMLRLQFEVDASSHPQVGARKVTTVLCLYHENEKPKQIARANLASILSSCGMSRCADTSDLLGLQLRIKLTVRKAEGDYPEGNDVRGYKPLSQEAAKPAPATKPNPEATSQAAPAPAKRPAWK